MGIAASRRTKSTVLRCAAMNTLQSHTLDTDHSDVVCNLLPRLDSSLRREQPNCVTNRFRIVTRSTTNAPWQDQADGVHAKDSLVYRYLQLGHRPFEAREKKKKNRFYKKSNGGPRAECYASCCPSFRQWTIYFGAAEAPSSNALAGLYTSLKPFTSVQAIVPYSYCTQRKGSSTHSATPANRYTAFS